MKIAILEIESKKKVYREYNGGYGTSFNAGRSFLGKMLTSLRVTKENFPYLPYAYIATIFKQNGHEVSIVKNKIPDADLIITHASMPNHSIEKRYLKKLKELNKKVGIIGPFASAKPELFPEATFIIQGEPESVVLEIAKTNKIPEGIVTGEIIKNLDELPYPDWNLFPIKDFSYAPIITKKPFTFVLTSRRCAYACNYCPYISEASGGNKYTMRSVDNVIGELKYLRDKFNVKGIQFRDPMFTLFKKRIEELCTAIIRENIQMEFGCETRLDRLDKPMIDLMYKAGFRALKVGIESADPEVLRKSKRKPIELEHQEDIIRYCQKVGMRVIGFYVIGLENDTIKTIKATLAYSKKLNTDFANFTICTPIPGTEFYETIKDRIFTDNYDLYDNFHVVFNHPNVKTKDLYKYQEKALVSYYLRPAYIYKYIKTNFFNGNSSHRSNRVPRKTPNPVPSTA